MMRYSLLIQGVVLFLVPPIAASEIFELVHDYDLMAEDIRSADLDNDGLDDFAIVEMHGDSSGYEIFLSNGDGSFDRSGWMFISTTSIDQLLLDDWIEDDDQDLLFTGDDTTWMYAGDGAGSFSHVNTYFWALHNGCTGDYNEDGHADLVGISGSTSQQIGDSLIVLLGNSQGEFAFKWSYTVSEPNEYFHSVQSTDVNNDLIQDLCVPCGNGFLVFLGVGDGSFTDPDIYPINTIGPYICTLGDFDEDSYMDIALAGDAGMPDPAVIILINQQDGTFPLIGYDCFYGSSYCERISTADLNLDGHLDLSYASSDGGTKSGDGDGIFLEYPQLSDKPWSKHVLLDIENDSDLDIVDRFGNVFENTTIMQGIEGSSVTSPSIQVLPNPFSSTVVITTPNVTQIPTELRIYDLTGRLVSKISPETTECSTVYTWDGRSGTGEVLPSGVYCARLVTGDTEQKLMILKL